MAVLMRHATKKWNNNKKPKNCVGEGCDPPIIGEEEVLRALEKLPKINTLVVSPFLRTRQTAEIIARERNITRIIYDPDLREYLGNQKGKPVRLDNFTFEKLQGKKIIESWDEFYERCIRLKSKGYWNSPTTCVIGHSLTFSVITKELTGKSIELDPGDFFILPTDSEAGVSRSFTPETKFQGSLTPETKFQGSSTPETKKISFFASNFSSPDPSDLPIPNFSFLKITS